MIQCDSDLTKKQQEPETGVSSSCHTNQPNLLLLPQNYIPEINCTRKINRKLTTVKNERNPRKTNFLAQITKSFNYEKYYSSHNIYSLH